MPNNIAPNSSVLTGVVDRSGTARNGESEYGHIHLPICETSGSAGLGVAGDTTIRDYRGHVVANEASVLVAQARGNLQLIGLDVGLGNQDNIGVNYSLSLDASAELGGYVAGQWDDNAQAASGRIGAYVGVDASEEFNLGFRYFGWGNRSSVGLGAGGAAGGSASNENGRLSLTAWANGGLGATAGQWNQIWFDYGRIGQDISDLTSWVGGGISAVFAAGNPQGASIS